MPAPTHPHGYTGFVPSIGQSVLIDGHGLSSVRLTVAEPKGNGYFALDFAHNGNRLPSFYHAALMRAA